MSEKKRKSEGGRTTMPVRTRHTQTEVVDEESSSVVGERKIDQEFATRQRKVTRAKKRREEGGVGIRAKRRKEGREGLEGSSTFPSKSGGSSE